MDSVEEADTRVGVLDKAMTILQVFPRGDSALSPQEIAERTGLPLPTVYRLAQALSGHGLLMKQGQRFRLGMTLLRLGAQVAEGISVREQALGHLKWLNQQTGENVELHIRYEETRIAVEQVRSLHNLRPFVDMGAPLPLHLGAGGKVLLAWLPPLEREGLIAASVARFGKRQNFDLHKLNTELERIGKFGWAASEGERAAGISAIAAPIFDVKEQVAGALILAAPTVRLGPQERDRFMPIVCEAARRVSHDLGYIDRQHHFDKAEAPLEGQAKDD
jgi:DNA-binding IclR family transcriptional regulator